jgi:hypothetical protein
MNVISINMSAADIILVDTIESRNTPAIILSCASSIQLKLKANFIQVSGQVEEIQMILSNYNRYMKTSQDYDAIILSPCQLSLHGTLEGARQHIDVNMSDIKITISPPMVNTVTNILTKIGARSLPEDEKTTSIKNVKDLFKAKKNDGSVWYLSYVPSAQEITEELVSVDGDGEGQDETDIKLLPQQTILRIKSINIIIESGGVESQPLIMINTSLQGLFFTFTHPLHCNANC